MKRLSAALLLTVAATAAAQSSQPPFEYVTDLKAVLALMTGPVDLYGDTFGTVPFQRGVLSLAQAKTIQVRVLTTPASIANLRPLKAVGAQIFTVPSKLTGSLVIVRGKAVIIPTKGGFNVFKTASQVNQIQSVMEQYWSLATASR